MQIQLPVIVNPPRIRKDKSVGLSFDTRELLPDEVLSLLTLSGTEGWVCISPNQEELSVPEEQANTDTKSPSERLRDVLYVLYKQRTDSGEYVGLFDTFYREQVEKLIEFIKSKLK